MPGTGEVARGVVLFGGTFDPVHNGHLAAARGLRDAIGAEATWLVPSCRPPHRRRPRASPSDRLRMVELAVADQPGVVACDREVVRGGISYTHDTVVELRARHPGIRFWLGLGADAARGLATWHRARELLDLVSVLLYDRPGIAPLGTASLGALVPPGRLSRVVIDAPAISATQVRHRLAAGDPCRDVLPPAVAADIAAHGRYRGPAATGTGPARWDNRAP